MPYVLVQSLEGRSAEQKAACGEAITAALVEHLGAPREAVFVVFEDVAATDWMVGGETMAARRAAKGG